MTTQREGVETCHDRTILNKQTLAFISKMAGLASILGIIAILFLSSTLQAHADTYSLPRADAYDMQGRWLDRVSIGQPVILSAEFPNNRDEPQPFVAIIEVRNPSDITVLLTTLDSTMKPGSIVKMDVSWTAAEAGTHVTRTFLVTNLTNPIVIYGVGTRTIPVTED